MKKTVERVPFAEVSRYERKRVAAYARVSSGKDAMLHSLAAQVSYYNELIQNRAEWEFCGIYADEAITGTKIDRRNFQRLIEDCEAGKIDMVITKSISRFARNTVSLLESVRKLKSLGVDVYFEEQHIHSMSADGELILTVLAAYAQEESLSVSENQKWRVKRNFEAGKPWNCTMLGYRYDGEKLVIEPAEAEVVKRIFREYLSGKGQEAILRGLVDDGIPTRRNKTWSKTMMSDILQNYTYTGNLILQTTFRADHICKTATKNEGQLPMYHVEKSHEAIVSIEDFQTVQLEMARRRECFADASPQGVYPFRSLIECGCCGKHYKRKVTHTGPVWICPTYNNLGKKYCASKAIPETTLENMALEVLGSLDGVRTDLKGIRTGENNTLIFTFHDGTECVKQWQDRSRSESWTPEMREAARSYARKGREKNG